MQKAVVLALFSSFYDAWTQLYMLYVGALWFKTFLDPLGYPSYDMTNDCFGTVQEYKMPRMHTNLLLILNRHTFITNEFSHTAIFPSARSLHDILYDPFCWSRGQRCLSDVTRGSGRETMSTLFERLIQQRRGRVDFFLKGEHMQKDKWIREYIL